MTILQAIMMGIVEGITEFLPISSTGHLILTSRLLGLADSDFLKSFEIIIQLGAILSVVVLYWKQLWKLEMIKKLLVAFLPTAAAGLALYGVVKKYLLGSEVVVLWALFLGGLVLIIFEKYQQNHLEAGLPSEDNGGKSVEGVVGYRQAVIIGLFQALAIVPGVSRSAATILGGIWLGLKRQTIVEFSFLLAVPTMLAATGLDLVKNYQAFSVDQFGVLGVGFVVSFVVALGAIKFLLDFIRRHDFTAFGWYRIVLAVTFWLIVM